MLQRQSPSGPITGPVAISADGTLTDTAVPANSVELVNVAIPGAKPGDSVSVSQPSGAIPAGLLIGAARISGADTGVVMIGNLTGGPVNTTALVLKCTIFRS